MNLKELGTISEEVLTAARRGSVKDLLNVLENVPGTQWSSIVNTPGDSKTNKSWSALQLASYFGHLEVVTFLISIGADVDYQNESANTALHLAAFTKRNEIVLALLNTKAQVLLVNGEGKTPKQMSIEDSETFKMLEQAEKSYALEQERRLFEAVRLNKTDAMLDLLNAEGAPCINCKDHLGNTPLHVAANLNKHESAIILLQNGANPGAINNNHLKPSQMTTRVSMKRLLSLRTMENVAQEVQKFEGEIFKRKVLLYKSFWVVLKQGTVHFYNRRDDALKGKNKKGFISLKDAKVKADTISNMNELTLRLPEKGGLVQHWAIKSGLGKAADLALRQKWISALKLHIDYASRRHFNHSGSNRMDFDVSKPSVADNKTRSATRSSFSSICAENNHLQSIRSVKDALLNSESLVTLLGTQISQVVDAAGNLGVSLERKEKAASATHEKKKSKEKGGLKSPVMVAEMERLVAQMDKDSGVWNGDNGDRLNGSDMLSTDHVKLIKQLIDVSELSQKVLQNLQQCITVMSQQEEYRLEQLAEANRKNVILENALRILAVEHHSLELAVNESLSSPVGTTCCKVHGDNSNSATAVMSTSHVINNQSQFISKLKNKLSENNNNTQSIPMSVSISSLSHNHNDSSPSEVYNNQNQRPPSCQNYTDWDEMSEEMKQMVVGDSSTVPCIEEFHRSKEVVVDDSEDENDQELFYDALSVNEESSLFTSDSAFVQLQNKTDFKDSVLSSANKTDEIENSSEEFVCLSPSVIRDNAAVNGLKDFVFGYDDKLSLLQSMFSQRDITFEEENVCQFLSELINTHRQTLPAVMASGRLLSVWETLKELLGKDLTRVSMPVYFNEPLSMLQRSCEFIENVHLLAKASTLDDAVSRMVLISTYVITSLNSLADRVNKPFNPLLGETFQFVDENLGFRFLAEQVSHHPPVTAFNFQSSFVEINCNSAPVISFGGLGQSIQVRVMGNQLMRLKVKKQLTAVHIPPQDEASQNFVAEEQDDVDTKEQDYSKHRHKQEEEDIETISWYSPKYVIHNIIAGQLWLEQTGCVTLTNHTNNCRVDIEYKPAGFFKNTLHDVEAFVCDANGIKRVFLFGKWTEVLYAIPVEVMTEFLDRKPPHTSLIDSLKSHPSCCLVWKQISKEDTSDYFNFTRIAFILNEKIADECVNFVPRSDSRLRPDIRCLEEGNLSKASEEKHRLEQKQRNARTVREKTGEVWRPLWFDDNEFDAEFTSKDQSSTSCTHNGQSQSNGAPIPFQRFTFNNKYWLKDYGSCPDIF